MRHLSILYIFALVLLSSCSKSGNNATDNEPLENGLWLNHECVFPVRSSFYEMVCVNPDEQLNAFVCFIYKDDFAAFPHYARHYLYDVKDPERIILSGLFHGDGNRNSYDLSDNIEIYTISSLQFQYSKRDGPLPAQKLVKSVKPIKCIMNCNTEKLDLAFDIRYNDGDIVQVRYSGKLKHSGVLYW